jgi:hypothetical protein
MEGKAKKIIYRSATGLLTVIVLMYVGNSFFNNELFSKRFIALGYPAYLIYPLSFAKILALIAIWSNKSKVLKEWAYAGLSFVFILAIMAETHIEGGEYFSSPMAFVLLSVSYVTGKKIFGSDPKNKSASSSTMFFL